MTAEGIEIRPAAAADADAALAAYEWLFAPPGTPPPGWDPAAGRERLLETVADPQADLLLALEGSAIVGICSVYLDLRSIRYGDRCWLEDLAVDPESRSAGIGAALLAAAKDWARERGASHLELDSGEDRHDAHRFYERERPAWRSKQFSWLLDE